MNIDTKKAKRKLPLHHFLIVKATAPSYSEDKTIAQYRNEHHTKSGEIITDSYLGICDKLYHLECENRPKGNMSIRMIELEADKILAQAHERGLARGLQKDLSRVQSVHDFAVGFRLIPVVILEDKGLSVHDATSRTGKIGRAHV